jgi:hypothetical protein
MATKYYFFCLLLFEATFSSLFKDKKSKRSQKTTGIKVFLTTVFLLDERRIRIHTSYQWIQIREAQKNPDPQNWILL